MPSQQLPKATFDQSPMTTGRDGAIDFADKSQVLGNGDLDAEGAARFVWALGQAVVQSWGDLRQEDQERLFERAVTAGHHSEADEMLREQLAKFLHDHHKRTASAPGTDRQTG